MVRWLKQRDTFRCGPIALANVMKWAGIKEFEKRPVSKKMVEDYLTKRCWCSEKGIKGMHPKYFKSILRTLPELEVVICNKPNRNRIKKCLNLGGIVVMEGMDHYYLLVDHIGNGLLYEAVNYETPFIHGDTISHEFKHNAKAYLVWKKR